MTDETYDRISAWVKENYPNGIELYADYRDEISPNEAQEILNAKYPSEKFIEWIYEAYMDYADDETRHAYKKMTDDLELEDDYGENWDAFMDECYCVYPENHFLKQVFDCDIFIDSGDWDSEFDVNIMYPMYNALGKALSPKEIDNENVILWLAKKQGYTKTQLWKYMNSYAYRKNNRNVFLDSCYQECLNTLSDLNGLVFCKKFTLGELIDIKENKLDVKVAKDINGGLFNRWWGSGSLLEIELEKDMVVTQDEIFDIRIDDAIRRTVGYGIDDVYGMCSSFWR